MSDQSNSANANVGGATGAAAPQADIMDRLASIEARLTAIENAPKPAAASGISDNQKSALSRVLKAIFGEDLAD